MSHQIINHAVHIIPNAMLLYAQDAYIISNQAIPLPGAHPTFISNHFTFQIRLFSLFPAVVFITLQQVFTHSVFSHHLNYSVMFVNTLTKNSSASNHNLVITNAAHRYNYQPLVSGDIAPSFILSAQHGLINSFNGNISVRETIISLQDFIDYQQPLVILFLGVASRASLNVKRLETLQHSIQRQGGKLLILTPVEPKYIRRQLTNSSLTIFHDKDNEIAEAFGLFNEQNPLWQWVSGIDEEEETLPAFYVIAPDRSISYQFIDFDFLLYRNNNYHSLHFINDLLDDVYKVSQQYHPQKAYKLVS